MCSTIYLCAAPKGRKHYCKCKLVIKVQAQLGLEDLDSTESATYPSQGGSAAGRAQGQVSNQVPSEARQVTESSDMG